MSMLSSFLHPGRGYERGQEQYDKYYGQSQGYLNPYNQNGQNAYGGLNNAMNSLLDPQALQDKWIKGYQESGAAKNAEGLAQEHGLNAASSMGLMGSSPALAAIQQGTSQIGLQDRQNYLNDLMQKYQTGIGLGQNIYGVGANAAGQMSNNANQMGNNSAQMAYGQQNAGGQLFGNILGTGIDLASMAMGMPMGGGWTTGGR